VTLRPGSIGLAAALLVLAGCGGGTSSGSALVVLAASSMTDAFGELEQAYESEHDGVDVRLSFDSSSTLAEQVVQGAPADVLATADEDTMQSVVDAGLTAGQAVPFAQNRLALVTPPDNPALIDSIADLDAGGVAFAVCVPDAPCGAATQRLLDLAGVTADAVTQEDNVRDTLGKVTEGEVDAGLVYVSDARAAGNAIHLVPVPQAARVLNSDLIAVLSDAGSAPQAQDWVDLVTSSRGQQVLRDHGFLPAPRSR